MRSKDTAVNLVPTGTYWSECSPVVCLYQHEENKRQGPIGTSYNGEENGKKAGFPEIGIDISFS